MLLAFAAVAGWAAQGRGGAAEWLLFAAAAAAAAVAWVVPYLGAGRITAERSVESGRPEDGGQLTVRLTIRASLPMPLMWVAVGEEIRNLSASGENGLEARFVYVPWFSRTRTLTYTVSGLRRGELAFDGPTVACGDLLGMTARTFYPACSGSVTVRPRPPRGENANPPGGAMPGGVDAGGAGAAAGAAAWQRDSRVRLQPGASPQTRIYRPGDPLRLVSWRAMARGLGMQTRVGSPEPPGEIALLLDISAASYAGSDRQFDAAAGRAAAALRETVAAGRSATLLAGGRRWRVRAGDGAALLAAEEALGQLRVSGEIRLDEWLPAALAGLPRGADVVCVTADPRSINPAAGYGARAGRAARRAARNEAAGHAADGRPAMPGSLGAGFVRGADLKAGDAAGLAGGSGAMADVGPGFAADREAKPGIVRAGTVEDWEAGANTVAGHAEADAWAVAMAGREAVAQAEAAEKAGMAGGVEANASARLPREAEAKMTDAPMGSAEKNAALDARLEGSSERQAGDPPVAAGETAFKPDRGGEYARGLDREFAQMRSASDVGRKAKRRRDAKADAAAIEGMERMAASAKWVQSRGGTFHLWLGIGSAAGQSEAWMQTAGGAGMRVVPLKLTDSYLAEPVVTAVREEGAAGHGRT